MGCHGWYDGVCREQTGVPWPQPWHFGGDGVMGLGICRGNHEFPPKPVATPTEAHGSSAVIAADLHSEKMN